MNRMKVRFGHPPKWIKGLLHFTCGLCKEYVTNNKDPILYNNDVHYCRKCYEKFGVKYE
jgi:hypothetical protein